jgi:YrbI family 3-deoxy-D-manno-octulosonate 8-phosphate phosphatase
MKLTDLCQPIELILSDVDGVLTDGGIILDNQGIETKRFHVRDGLGVKLWQRAGGKFGLITARSSHVLKVRAAEMGADIVRQGADDKLVIVQEILMQLGLQAAQACYLGDDLPDLAVLRYVGLGVSVADGCEEARSAAAYVTAARGGEGALRETVEMILKYQHRWEDVIRTYGA